LRVLDGVPEAGGFLVTRIEIVETSQSTANLATQSLWFRDSMRDEKTVDGVFDGGGLLGKSRRMELNGIKIARVEAVVAGVLILGFIVPMTVYGMPFIQTFWPTASLSAKSCFFVSLQERRRAGLFVIPERCRNGLRVCDTANPVNGAGRDDGNRAAVKRLRPERRTEFGHDVFLQAGVPWRLECSRLRSQRTNGLNVCRLLASVCGRQNDMTSLPKVS